MMYHLAISLCLTSLKSVVLGSALVHGNKMGMHEFYALRISLMLSLSELKNREKLSNRKKYFGCLLSVQNTIGKLTKHS